MIAESLRFAGNLKVSFDALLQDRVGSAYLDDEWVERKGTRQRLQRRRENLGSGRTSWQSSRGRVGSTREPAVFQPCIRECRRKLHVTDAHSRLPFFSTFLRRAILFAFVRSLVQNTRWSESVWQNHPTIHGRQVQSPESFWNVLRLKIVNSYQIKFEKRKLFSDLFKQIQF